MNKKRALFVLTRIDEILAWEQRHEAERDTRFVELGKYLCEVRAGQYWRVEKLKSFDEFLERRFPESRRKAYYLMRSTNTYRPQPRIEEGSEGSGLDEEFRAGEGGASGGGGTSTVQPGCIRHGKCRKRSLGEVEKQLTWRETEHHAITYFKLDKNQLQWPNKSSSPPPSS